MSGVDLSSPSPAPPPGDSGLRVAVLGSGSAGNSVVLGSSRGYVLLDAGFSCRETERRLGRLGLDPLSVDAIVLTHEHRDHSRGAERASRRWDVPVYGTRGTLEGCRFQKPHDVRLVPIASGVPFHVAGFEIEAFPVPHDAREPVGFVAEDEHGGRVGLVSDLGTVPPSVSRRLEDLDLLLQESNHDVDMLRRGPYPFALQRRVGGAEGHLSNDQAARALAGIVCDALRRVVLYHLSETNNLPALAEESVATELERQGSAAAVTLTHQSEPTGWLEVRS